MRKIIPFLQNNGFDLILMDNDRFLMKRNKTCVYHLGGNSYEVFKHVFQHICYSYTILNLKDPQNLLNKTKIIDEL